MKNRSEVNPEQSPGSIISGPDPEDRIGQPRDLESAEMLIYGELSDILEALQRLAAGDTTVKIREAPDGGPLSQLKRAVNQTGKNLAEIVDSAHEFAIGLAEHFDVLRRVSGGDLTARIRGTSGEEILQYLKEVTNATIETLADEIVSRRKAERDLQESEEKYRTLFEKSADPMILYGENGFIDCNEAATKFFLAEKREDLLGKQPWEMSPQQQPDGRSSREEANEMIETAWRLGSHQFEWTHIRANGDPFSAEISLTAIPYQDKRLFHAICRDITERKLAEEVHRKLEAQLSEAQRLEALGTLAGGIAHDFNNTLVPIIGYTEIALDDVHGDSPTRENLEKVLVSAERAKELVAQILTFSRQKDEQSARLRIAPAVKETLQLLRASLPSTIEIRPHIQADEVCVEAHPAQIHQLVMNLGTNSALAMEEQEHGVLEVRLEPADRLHGDDAPAEPSRLPPGAYVKLAIGDTGCGMVPEVKERIFEPFFTTRQATGGTGMGLSLVHGIVTKLGGAVYVRSEPGAGTTFEIFLPRLPAETEAAAEPARRELRGGTERILFVDDEELQVDFWTRALGRLGYDVVAMPSSADALEAFEADPDAFDLVITDQTMPHLTGESLARRFLELRPALPIILCTGFSKSVTPENVAAMGIRALLMKPCGILKMNETIRQALGETRELGVDPAEDEGLPRVVEARPPEDGCTETDAEDTSGIAAAGKRRVREAE